MAALAAFVRFVDGLNDRIGRAAAWLVLGTVVICAATALLRYVFAIGFVWMQELYVVLFALTFMLCAGYCYRHNKHVRVDIFHAAMSARRKAWVEIVGTMVFLLPWLAVLALSGLPFIAASWRVLEPSNQSGGLPGFFLFKSVILVFCLLLGLQGLSAIARNVLVLGRRDGLLEAPVRPPR